MHKFEPFGSVRNLFVIHVCTQEMKNPMIEFYTTVASKFTNKSKFDDNGLFKNLKDKLRLPNDVLDKIQYILTGPAVGAGGYYEHSYIFNIINILCFLIIFTVVLYFAGGIDIWKKLNFPVLIT